tara:strand:- start:338 stop:1072 length:735 start_codon:yes stop_codon:yes gene_type:complete
MKKTLILFDVDGTLTPSRLTVSVNMLTVLKQLRQVENITIGIVGGSDLMKQKEQLGEENLKLFDYVFSENGLYASHMGKLLLMTSIVSEMGEDNIKKLINASMKYIANLDIPVKRGTFIEFRNGMINLCPVGRSCSQEERMQSYQYDLEHNIRKKMVSDLSEELKDLNLTFSIGGQISIDVFPKGWDKTYCLQFVEDKFNIIHFFGDKTYPGGNDYEIFNDSRVIGHTVTSPEDTISQLSEFLE